jgi:4-amino-4-deoxy-L-arabinose transferase-like glycosyltransferase
MIDAQGADSSGSGLAGRVADVLIRRPLHAVFFAALAMTIARLALLFVTEADLGPDEAQYWVWSRSLDWGYFSKPPLIAWVIAATTSVFGQSEWAVRFSAPLFHMGAALAVAALGRMLYGPREAFWAGIGWVTLPGVALSSLVMTTDAPLLFFWCLSLLLFFAAAKNDLSPRRRIALAAALGASVGAGLLAKYAMIYFALGAGVSLILVPRLRRNLTLASLLVAAAVALAMVAPNIAWNVRHDFQTLSHTAANANWRDAGFKLDQAVSFLGAQIGVFGPLSFVLFAWGLATAKKRLSGPKSEDDAGLLAFALPPLIIVTAQAFISRAHANWAATAYPAALLLVVAWAFRANIGTAIKASAAIHVVGAAAFMAALTSFPLADSLGASSFVKRVRGWGPQGAEIARLAAGYDAVVVDDRELMGSLLYYARSGPPIVSWNSNGAIDSHYEATMAFDRKKVRRALFVTRYSDPRGVVGAFETIEAKGSVSADVKTQNPRRLFLFEVVGPKG